MSIMHKLIRVLNTTYYVQNASSNFLSGSTFTLSLQVPTLCGYSIHRIGSSTRVVPITSVVSLNARVNCTHFLSQRHADNETFREQTAFFLTFSSQIRA